MKKVMLATVALLATVGFASAADLSFGAWGEYATEDQEFSLGASATYELERVSLTADITFDEHCDELEFDGMDLSASYEVSDQVDIYARFEFDDQLEHDETVLGVAAKF